MDEEIPSEGSRYCDRCKQQVPIEEFVFFPTKKGGYFKHMGEMRGAMKRDDDDDKTCGAVLGSVSFRNR